MSNLKNGRESRKETNTTQAHRKTRKTLLNLARFDRMINFQVRVNPYSLAVAAYYMKSYNLPFKFTSDIVSFALDHIREAVEEREGDLFEDLGEALHYLSQQNLTFKTRAAESNRVAVLQARKDLAAPSFTPPSPEKEAARLASLTDEERAAELGMSLEQLQEFDRLFDEAYHNPEGK